METHTHTHKAGRKEVEALQTEVATPKGARAHTLAHTHTRSLSHTHALTHTHTHSHTHTHTHTHTRTHKQTHIHTHTHTHKQVATLKGELAEALKGKTSNASSREEQLATSAQQLSRELETAKAQVLKLTTANNLAEKELSSTKMALDMAQGAAKAGGSKDIYKRDEYMSKETYKRDVYRPICVKIDLQKRHIDGAWKWCWVWRKVLLRQVGRKTCTKETNTCQKRHMNKRDLYVSQ